MYIDLFNSPIGLLKIVANDNSLLFVDRIISCDFSINPNNITEETKKQLESYFLKKIKKFDLPILINNLDGSNFNKKVWEELKKIPYGQTKSYKEIAQNLKNPNAFRAVGNANNKNPILIIIPCHRVIKNDGTIGGYAFGSDIKRQLLALEGN